MRHRRGMKGGAAVVALLLMAQAAAAIEVTAPAAGSVLTHMPVTIQVDFDAAANLGTLAVSLNGNDITGLFGTAPIGGGKIRATAAHVWGGLVLAGANLIEASVEVGGNPQATGLGFDTTGDPYADEVVAFTAGTNGGLNAEELPGIVLGAPQGEGLFLGSFDVVSLGVSGSIAVRMADNVIVDGPGADFTVFENAFLEIGAGSLTQPPFAEPGRVEVSQDGVTWFAFACDLSESAGPYWPGCAGVYPVLSDGTLATPHPSIPTTTPIGDLVGISVLSIQAPAGAGGDSFDLADVGLAWARYVRIVAAGFAPPVTGTGDSAFDFDAVAAIHSSPTVPPAVPVPAASVGARLLLALLLALAAFRAGAPARADEFAVAPAAVARDAIPAGPTVAQRLAQIHERVQAAARYPEIARSRNVEGDATVAFAIDARGVPIEIAVAATSGSGALDRAAVRAVEDAAPLPWVSGRIEVPIRFALEDAP